MSDGQDIIEQLDRLHAFFAERDDADVYAELHRFVEALRGDPRTLTIAHELVDECTERLQRVRERDQASAAELAALRRELVVAFPEFADTEDDVRSGNDVDPERGVRSLAHFDELVERECPLGQSVRPRDADDRTVSTTLVCILRDRLSRLRKSPERRAHTQDLKRRIWDIEAKHRREFREWLLYTRTHGAASMVRIAGLAGYLNPAPKPAEADWFAFVARTLSDVHHPFADLRDATFDEQLGELVMRDAGQVTQMRTEVRRAYEEIRRRLLSARSHRALVVRFAQWVQLYEAAELHALAKKSPRKVEDVLTQRLARFLFERGLNPLTRANIGTTQPDLLDATTRWTFYVEAKQYKNAKGKTVVRDAVKQIADTLLRVRALPHGVREAFLVVFRVAGPLLVLPRELVVGGVRVWPVLIDLAPSSQTGSRQKHAPVVVEAAELLP